MAKTPTTDAKKEPESQFSKLRQGLLMLNIQKEMDEPGYSAIDRITFERGVIEKRHAYAGEIERVFGELKLTTELLANVNDQIITKHKTHEPEELINYYSGIFLDLVHQVKDKLLRLIDLMLAQPPYPKAYPEPENVRLASFLKKHKASLEQIGIYDLIQKWEQNDNPIGVVLRRRTQHHHFASRLALNEDYQKIQMSRIMLQPVPVEHLTDYGKTRMEELGKNSYEKWKAELLGKQQKTIAEIETTIEDVAQKLIKHFKIETDPLELGKIGAKYTDFLGTLRIENKASKSKIKHPLNLMIDPMVETAKQQLGQHIVSIYLVGSAARDEFIGHISDVNFYLITNGFTHTFDAEFPLNVVCVSETDLLSDKHKKDRFIIWSDGVLMHGKELKFEAKDFPKPGTLLALLLNRDYKDTLNAIKAEVAALKKPSDRTLRTYSLKVARIIMDFDFGVAMSNKPFYTASRKEKISYTKELFPKPTRTLTIEQIYNGAVVRQEDFPVLIDTFIESVEENFNKMLAIEKEIETNPSR